MTICLKQNRRSGVERGGVHNGLTRISRGPLRKPSSGQSMSPSSRSYRHRRNQVDVMLYPGAAFRSFARTLKHIRSSRQRKVDDALGIVPVIIDGAKEAACNIIRYATFALHFGRESCIGIPAIVERVEPLSNGHLQPAGVITARIVCSGLQLDYMLGPAKRYMYRLARHTGAQKDSMSSAPVAFASKPGISLFKICMAL
jgi:hypothetical protein